MSILFHLGIIVTCVVLVFSFEPVRNDGKLSLEERIRVLKIKTEESCYQELLEKFDHLVIDAIKRNASCVNVKSSDPLYDFITTEIKGKENFSLKESPKELFTIVNGKHVKLFEFCWKLTEMSGQEDKNWAPKINGHGINDPFSETFPFTPKHVKFHSQEE